MCNEIALRLHIRPGGDEVILHRDAHPIIAEAGGPAALASAMMNPLEGDAGMFTAEAARSAIRHRGDRYSPRSRLLWVEQTTNMGGGRIWPLEQVREVLGVAAEHGLRTHLDGARLMNAVVAGGVAAAEWAGDFDTAWIDFTKGLGAPVGACLAGSEELIEEAWRWKQMMGGALRQAGIVAAAGLYALDHHVERLAEDHANARALAEGLAELPGVEIDPAAVETNIVIFAVADAPAFCAALGAAGVDMGALDARRVRAVTHLDVDRDGFERARDAAREVMAGPRTAASAPARP
jgi:threonine aldolase